MCQVLSINNLSNIDKDDFTKLSNVIKIAITKSNRDGYGMAVFSDTGLSTFKTVDYDISYAPDSIGNISNVISMLNFEYSGNHDFETVKSAIFHGRTSTNKTGLKNCHPIVMNGQCIVHNGVIDYSKPVKKVLDTDSEYLAYVTSNLKQDLEKHVTGYYAFLNLLSDGRVQIVKDNVANLYMTYCPDIDSQIVGTSKDLIAEICTAMDWSHESVYSVLDNIIFTIDNNNTISNVQNFTPLGFTKRQSKKAKTSLGRDIGSSFDGGSDYYGDDYSVYGSETDDTIDELLLYEFKNADASWTFYYNKSEISVTAFNELSDSEKLKCHVVDWEGTELTRDSMAQLMDVKPDYAG